MLDVLDFETLDKRGSIRGTWMEYIHSATDRINDANGKRIILYICQNKERKVTRDEIRNALDLSMTDRELEKRLKAFVKADIIEQGTSYFSYHAVQDHIFDKVFRGVYQEEIDGFTPDKIKDEYRILYKKLRVDVFAKAGGDAYSLIGEVKNRKKKFSLTEARAFFAKASEVQKLEDISKTLLFVFSAAGFYKTAIDFFKKNGIAFSNDKRFLE
ncbi:conserved hypothetical protein [Candidatus Desulfarcum epimagneticum]|uniref:Uncharacterized protein n=1 Tax=uncultured Desulfobacteraceae bacterium TaxID=218296 RepID=A0A484HDA1_9BACT|nr:conserved hypothetical protein [uncultured Desulfobacteraceae bacterium]